ncbi:hypothetical protein EDB85DRAFT_2278796 [Lactarius pseudohatsudake]|nr:hypothetical protein EDB85DRAFT_2278796 [Lactarius pseudohatsudake]
MSRELISNSKLEELIAKHLHEGSNELHILEYLHTIRSQSPHIISLIKTIPLDHRGWLILPKLHLDIFHLHTIDVGVAIEVQGENTEVDEYRDTKGYTLAMHSPIKVDIGCHVMAGKGDNRLSEFAEQLMANDPQQRPLLKCYLNGTSGPLYRSVIANALVDCGKDPQPRQDMVEESMKLPDAKKPRLADDRASSSARYCDTQMST